MAGSEAEALRLLGGQPVAVLAVGAGLAAGRAVRLIEEAETAPGAERRVNLVLAGGPDPGLFQDLKKHSETRGRLVAGRGPDRPAAQRRRPLARGGAAGQR